MNIKLRKMAFWGRVCMEYMGVSVGVTLLWMLFSGAGSSSLSENVGEVFLYELSLFPYYLMFIGMLFIIVIGVSLLKVYLPVILSMNETRKSFTLGILCSVAGLVTGIVLISALVWRIVPGDAAAYGKKFLPICTGALFVLAAISMLLGAVIVRLGKVGGIVTTIICMLVGAGAGISFALFEDLEILDLIQGLVGGDYRLLAAAGIVFYLAVGAIVFRILRKIEVRA